MACQTPDVLPGQPSQRTLIDDMRCELGEDSQNAAAQHAQSPDPLTDSAPSAAVMQVQHQSGYLCFCR